MLIQKDILLNTAKLLISKLIPAILLTLITVIYSRSLSQSDYGSYQAIWTFLSIGTIFTSFGLPGYILTFGNILNKDNLRKVIRLSLLIFLLVLIPLIVYLFSYPNYFDFYTKVYFFLLLFFQTVYFAQEAYVVSHNQVQRLIWINSLYALLLFAVHVFVLFATEYKLSYCVLGIAVVSFFRNLLIWFSHTKSSSITGSNVVQSMTDYSLLFWLGLNDSLQILTKWLDKLLLLFMLSSAEYAIYFNGTFELPLISMVLMAFYSIITVYSSSKTANDEKRIELFGSSTLFMSGIIFPLFAWMFLFASPIVTILFGNKYEGSAVFFALSALFLPMRICSYTVLLQIKNKGRLILTGSILDLILSILLMVLLYPFLQLKGLVLALVIATYVQAIYYLVQISKIYNVSFSKLLPFQKLFQRFIVVFSIVAIIKYSGVAFSPIYSLVMGSLVCGLFVIFYIKKSYSVYSS